MYNLQDMYKKVNGCFRSSEPGPKDVDPYHKALTYRKLPPQEMKTVWGCGVLTPHVEEYKVVWCERSWDLGKKNDEREEWERCGHGVGGEALEQVRRQDNGVRDRGLHCGCDRWSYLRLRHRHLRCVNASSLATYLYIWRVVFVMYILLQHVQKWIPRFITGRSFK